MKRLLLGGVGLALAIPLTACGHASTPQAGAAESLPLEKVPTEAEIPSPIQLLSCPTPRDADDDAPGAGAAQPEYVNKTAGYPTPENAIQEQFSTIVSVEQIPDYVVDRDIDPIEGVRIYVAYDNQGNKTASAVVTITEKGGWLVDGLGFCPASTGADK